MLSVDLLDTMSFENPVATFHTFFPGLILPLTALLPPTLSLSLSLSNLIVLINGHV